MLKGLSILKHIMFFTPEQCFRFAVDGVRQSDTEGGWQSFEREEPGRIKAVLNGFAFIVKTICSDDFDANTALSLGLILKLHEIATTGVYLGFKFEPGKIRKESVCYSLLLKDHSRFDNVSVEGITELYSLYLRDPRRFGLLKEHKLTIEDFITLFLKTPVTFFGEGDSKISMDEFAILHDPVPTLYPNYKDILDKYQKIISDALSSTIDFYTSNIITCETNEQKLNIIVQTIQKFEQIHPFADGNYRTFCILLLNYLLLINNFSPVILHDPNRFDGYSVSQMLAECVIGFENVNKLLSSPEEKICGFSILSSTAADKEKLISYAKAFLDTISIIEASIAHKFRPSVK